MRPRRASSSLLLSALAVLLAMVLPRDVSAAEPFLSPVEIQNQVQAFLVRLNEAEKRDVRIEVKAPDSRLRLPRCEEALQFERQGQRSSGNVVVSVRCGGGKSWQLYVQAVVTVYDKVVVTTRPLQRGAVLSPSDVTVVDQDISRLSRSYYSDPSKVEGRALKWGVVAGAPLGPQELASEVVVRRGERVRIVAGTDDFSVSMMGEALEDGGVGESIKIRNLSSKRIVEGRVTRAGTVQVEF